MPIDEGRFLLKLYIGDKYSNSEVNFTPLLSFLFFSVYDECLSSIIYAAIQTLAASAL